MSLLIKHACMDVLFEYKANLGNITISIEPEAAMLLNIGDEIVLIKENFPKGQEKMAKVFNTRSSSWKHFSINYFYLVDYMEFYTKIYPEEKMMIIKIDKKIYLNKSTIQFIARVLHPNLKNK